MTDSVGNMVIEAARVLAGRQRTRLRAHDLTATGWAVLDRVAGGPRHGTPLGAVARHLGVAPSTVTAVSDQLTGRGLLIRVRPPDNRRVVLAALTGAGVRLVEKVRAELHEAVLGERLDPGERDLLTALLRRLVGVRYELE